MSKYVTDTKAGKSVSAWIILNPEGKQVAKVQACWSDAGVCLVNVFNWGVDEEEHDFQYARASGYGYDKLNQCLSGMFIDGHELSNHCGVSLPTPEGGFDHNTKCPKGYMFSNYNQKNNSWSSCYKKPGLDYLSGIGYTVFQAI